MTLTAEPTQTYSGGRDQPWMREGACTQPGVNRSNFFPPKEQGFRKQIDKAKAVCRSCPVLQQCFDYALDHEAYGIWGMSTERERESLRHHLDKPRMMVYEGGSWRACVINSIPEVVVRFRDLGLLDNQEEHP